MIGDNGTIGKSKLSYKVSSMPYGCISMEERGTSITQLDPFNGSPLFPIGLLLLQKGEESIL